MRGCVIADQLLILGVLRADPAMIGCGRGSGTHLELERRVDVQVEELDQPRHHARIDDLLDGRVTLDGQQLAELRRALDVRPRVAPEDALRQAGQLLGGQGWEGRGKKRRRLAAARNWGEEQCLSLGPRSLLHHAKGRHKGGGGGA